MPARACILFGPRCSDGGKAISGTSRCAAHTSSNWARSKHPHAHVYKSQQWAELRRRVLTEQPVCARPGCDGRSTSVDHIVSLADGGQPYDRTNCRGLCHDHHKRRSSQQGAAAKRRKRGKQ